METIFTKIAEGEIPAYKILESEQFLAFLDISPLKRGHMLVIPKKHTDDLFDIDDQELAEMIVFAKKVAKALKKTYQCRKVGVAVLGLEVPHAHIHLVPINEERDINFSNAKLSLEDDEMKVIADTIKGNL
ncbi:MAG: HIT family protein [Salinivirgaceae bacterium]|jgi:histidine triad (HIT) family protein|nr:HIT family protein [Salinivirgaceae bacterium]